MSENKITKEGKPASEPPPLSFFACPNPDCADFNQSLFGGLAYRTSNAGDNPGLGYHRGMLLSGPGLASASDGRSRPYWLYDQYGSCGASQ